MGSRLDPWIAAARRHGPLDFAWRLGEALRQDQLADMAAKMAYYFMLSLFPALIVLVGILDALPMDALLDQLVADLDRMLPGPASELIQGYLVEFKGRKPSGLVSLWGLAALWAASRGMADARKSMNKVFRVTERRSVMRLRVVSLLFTVVGLGLITLAYVFLVGGPELGRGLADWVGFGESFFQSWNQLRWPMVLGFLVLFLLLAYRYLPYRRVRFRYLLAGAVPTVLGWVGLGLGFRLFLSQAGKFDEIYGSLASVMLLLIFLWAFAMIFLLGGEVAAVLAAGRGESAVEGGRVKVLPSDTPEPPGPEEAPQDSAPP